MIELTTGFILISTLIEGLITYIFGEEQSGRTYLRYISLALGIMACFAYKIDILAMIGLVSDLPFVGYIVSGLIVGRGANYLNDIFKLIQKK
jgi:hypothetical protein